MAALCQEDTCTKIKDTNGEVEKDKKKKKKSIEIFVWVLLEFNLKVVNGI